jgi:hypothetical protein
VQSWHDFPQKRNRQDHRMKPQGVGENACLPTSP